MFITTETGSTDIRKVHFRLNRMRTIALIRQDRLGDTCTSTPLLDAIAAHLSGAKIIWIGPESWHDLIRGHRNVQEVWPVSPSPSPSETASLTRAFQRAKPDAVMFLRTIGSLRHTIAPLLAGVPIRAGIAPRFTMARLTHRLDEYEVADLHMVRRQLKLLELVLGSHVEDFPMRASFTEKSHIGARRNLRDFGLPERFFAVQLGVGGSNRPVPPEVFGGVARQVQREFGLDPVLLGSDPRDEQLAQGFRKAFGGPARSLIGRTDLATLGEVLGGSKFLLSVDTGTVHLGAAVGCPSVVIMPVKETLERNWHPWMVPHRIVRPDRFCASCKRRCTLSEDTCVKTVSAERVADACRDLLGSLPQMSREIREARVCAS